MRVLAGKFISQPLVQGELMGAAGAPRKGPLPLLCRVLGVAHFSLWSCKAQEIKKMVSVAPFGSGLIV